MPTPRTAAEIVLLLGRLFRIKDFDAVHAAHHPEGRFVTLAGGPEPLGRDETVEAFRRAGRDFVYRAQAEAEPVEIDEVAALARGAVRYRTPGGGHAMAPRVWVFTQRDGRALYRDNGIGLGI